TCHYRVCRGRTTGYNLVKKACPSVAKKTAGTEGYAKNSHSQELVAYHHCPLAGDSGDAVCGVWGGKEPPSKFFSPCD
ncbi:TPA: hypothetical protein ACTADU_002790, partial [Salmonella enterica subsp. enterica serovar Warragul]